jgi:iron complex transport system ATP-binding protein
LPNPPLIEYKNVTVMRGNHRVLHNITLSVALGEHLAILGPNGAGKSSLIKTITRELHPVAQNSGSYMRILGKELWNVMELRNRLGIVSPEVTKSSFRSFTCQEIVLSGFFASAGVWPYYRVTAAMKEKTKEVMKLLGIYHLSRTRSDEISTGESRLLMIGRALVNDPSTMLLDEPTSSLDPQAARKIRTIMRKLAGMGKGILMITHNLSDIIPEVQRVVLIHNGRVVQDGQKETLLTAESLSALFGVELEVVKRGGYYYCW